jgi:SAM-dependent methyltransferase
MRDKRPFMSLVGVDFARNDPERGIEFLQADVLQTPIDRVADVVVSLAVIEHVRDPVAFAKRLLEFCNPAGRVAVMTLNDGSVVYATARLLWKMGVKTPLQRLYSPHHLQHFTSTSLRKCLERVGFRIVETHRHNAPMRAVDIPGSNHAVRAVQWLGVWMTFVLGRISRRTYLQTVIAERP